MARNHKHQKRLHITTEGFRPVANPEFADAMRRKARSSAASSPDPRARRLRTRRAAKGHAIREYV